MGRVAGAFCVWPLNFIEYARQFATLDMPFAERAKWFSRWLLANGAILGGFTAAGAAVGLGPEAARHTAEWTFTGPLSYRGGPLIDMFMGMPRMIYEATNGRYGLVKGTAKEFARTVIPLPTQFAQDVAGTAGISLPITGPGKEPEPAESTAEVIFRIGTGIQRR